MKNSGIKYLLSLLFFILFSCQKTNMGSQTVTIHASEYGTNRPVDDAMVTLNAEGEFDFNCFCTGQRVLLEGKTDYKGDFMVSRDIFNQVTRGITIYKPPYVTGYGDNTKTQFSLTLLELMKVRFIKANPYPQENLVVIRVHGVAVDAMGSGQDYILLTPDMTDTTLTMGAYGEQMNTVNLLVNDSSGNTISNQSFQVPVSKTDSSVHEIKY